MDKTTIVFILFAFQVISSSAQKNEQVIKSFFEEVFLSKNIASKELYKTYIFKNSKRVKREKLRFLKRALNI